MMNKPYRFRYMLNNSLFIHADFSNRVSAIMNKKITGNIIIACFFAYVLCSTCLAQVCTGPMIVPVTGATTALPLTISASNVVNETCMGASDGQISVTPVGGSPGAGYTYSWYDNPTLNSANRTGLSAGNYTVAITDAVLCTKITTFTVATPSTVVANSTYTAIPCFGGNTAITVNATGGTSPYQYQLGTGSFQSTNVLTAAAGGHSVTVKDANGCLAIVNVSITQPAALVVTPGSALNVCLGSPYNLSASASGGAGSFTYNWTGPINYANAQNVAVTSASLSDAGTYTITVTDANNCSTTATQSLMVNNLPLATIIASDTTTFCDGKDVSLQAPIVAGNTYQWLKNNLPITNATSDVYVADETGDFTVTVTNGCTATSAITSVTELPVPLAPTISAVPLPNPATGVVSICAGATAILTGSSASEYAWFKNGVFVNYSNISSSFAVGGAAGTDNYTLMVIYTPNGCPSALSSAISVVKKQPQATITASGPTSFCLNAATSTILTASAGVGYTYSWVCNVGCVGANAQTFSPTASGNHKVFVKDAQGCTNFSPWVSIKINPLPAAYAGYDKTVCMNAAELIGANNNPANTFSWSPSIGLSSTTIANPTVTPATVGLVSYIVSVTNSFGCVKKDTVNITGAAVPATPTLTRTSSPVCQGTSVTLTPGGSTGAVSWYKNGVLFSNAATSVPLVCTNPTSSADIYTVKAKQGNCLSSLSNAVNVMIHTAPTPIITSNPAMVGSTITLCKLGQTASTVPLTASFQSTVPMLASYQWAQVVSGAANNVGTGNTYIASVATIPTTQNNKIFRVTATYSNGCAKTSNNVLVKLLTSNCVPTREDVQDEVQTNILTVYPNPTQDVLNVAIQNCTEDEVNLQLFNELGQVVIERTLKISQGLVEDVFDVSKLTPGVYTISLKTREGMKTQKIVKE